MPDIVAIDLHSLVSIILGRCDLGLLHRIGAILQTKILKHRAVKCRSHTAKCRFRDSRLTGETPMFDLENYVPACFSTVKTPDLKNKSSMMP